MSLSVRAQRRLGFAARRISVIVAAAPALALGLLLTPTTALAVACPTGSACVTWPDPGIYLDANPAPGSASAVQNWPDNTNGIYLNAGNYHWYDQLGGVGPGRDIYLNAGWYCYGHQLVPNYYGPGTYLEQGYLAPWQGSGYCPPPSVSTNAAYINLSWSTSTSGYYQWQSVLTQF